MIAAVGPPLPLWALVPPAFLIMLLLAAYIQAMREADIPHSRRRIRTSASLVMMALQPLLVYLFGIGSAQTPRPFVFTWALVTGLVAILVILAMLDMLNNTRLATQRRADLRRELRSLRSELDALTRERQGENVPPKLRLTADDRPSPRSNQDGSEGS